MSEVTTETKSEQEVTSSQAQRDVLDQLQNPEVQESLNALIQQLPKLTEIVGALTKSYDFAKSVATDEVLKNDTVGAITEIAGPVVGKVKDLAATVIEAKDRAEASHEVIGVFGLMKMLKDPEAQKIFRFMNAYLQVAGEKKNQN
ncbi:Uncharacterized conserved protein YjgD, DUF1641 family [Fontibacillus panacisegetis]|uniref:Uncharacterized conserved protein YjgD, DUF1641 family n=1 Tax=Fontibacillus panacisegetis TaxID=670482 RepID=A0A1G7M9T3_9BACL|nr:DUF1641 domain-containing protein [Fontibacillus panacisegetis]SDF57930.1 Uncharacterized conserved protein YjgD, DUF1641 family [Fontibacillus panacisegetis]